MNLKKQMINDKKTYKENTKRMKKYERKKGRTK